MNIGIVTTWFERGAAYVSRQFEQILSENHNIFIYARGGEKYAKGDPNWDHQNVTWGIKLKTVTPTVINKRDFTKWIKTNNIELVIFNEQHWFQPILWCKHLNVKTIAYIDYYNELTLPLFDSYDALICNTKRHLSAFRNVSNSVYIPWGTDTELFIPKGFGRITPEVITFFHSAGMSGDRKGTDLFIKALYEIKADKYKAIIHTQKEIEGQFPELKNIIDELKSEGKIMIITETCSAPGYYHLGDVYVYPSRLEGIGLTIAEAISCGLIPVVPDNGPMNEFCNNEFGSLIPIERFYSRIDGYYWPKCDCNVEKLAHILHKYTLMDDSTVYALKKKSREYACEFLSFYKNFKALNRLVETVEFKAISKDMASKLSAYDFRGIKKYEKLLIKLGIARILAI